MALLSDRVLTQAVGLRLPEPAQQRYWAIKMLVNNNYVLLIKIEEKIIGMIMLSPWYRQEGQLMRGQYEIGYLMDRQFWGQGIMTRALQEVISSLPSPVVLHAECQEDNQRSKRVLARLGFRQEEQAWWRLMKK